MKTPIDSDGKYYYCRTCGNKYPKRDKYLYWPISFKFNLVRKGFGIWGWQVGVEHPGRLLLAWTVRVWRFQLIFGNRKAGVEYVPEVGWFSQDMANKLYNSLCNEQETRQENL